MKKAFKWIGIILGVLVLIVVVSVFILTSKADKLMASKFDIKPQYFTIPDDSASVIAGEKFSNLCRECHGKQLEGYAFFNEKDLGLLFAPNLTKGKGSAIKDYSDVDWLRAIRHGVRPNGDGLMIMPSKDYIHLTKEDIGSLIAYLKTIPAVDNDPEKSYLTTMGKVLLSVGAFGELYSANEIDHSKPIGSAPPSGATVEYGDYLVKILGCRSCHGKELNGGKDPNPNAPPVPNLTQAANLSKWNESQFITAMRNGTTPEGKQLDKKFMPYPAFAKLSDAELTAVYIYLKQLPAKETPKS